MNNFNQYPQLQSPTLDSSVENILGNITIHILPAKKNIVLFENHTYIYIVLFENHMLLMLPYILTDQK